MNRRTLLQGCLATTAVGLAGCLRAPDAPPAGRLEVRVWNADDHAHDVIVTMTDATGAVVDRSTLGPVQPSVSHTVSFRDGGSGPYELTVAGSDWRTTGRWDPSACADLTLETRITAAETALSSRCE